MMDPKPVPISMVQERAWRETWAWLLAPIQADQDQDEGDQTNPPEAIRPPVEINRVRCRDLEAS
jgi:hypothetical protein